MRVLIIAEAIFPSTETFVGKLRAQGITVDVVGPNCEASRVVELAGVSHVVWFEGAGALFDRVASVLSEAGAYVVARLATGKIDRLETIRRMDAVREIILPEEGRDLVTGDDPSARPRVHVIDCGTPEEQAIETAVILDGLSGRRSVETWRAWMSLGETLRGRTLLVGKAATELARSLRTSYGIELDCIDPDTGVASGEYETVVFWDALLSSADPAAMFGRLADATDAASRIMVSVPTRPAMFVPGKQRRVPYNEIARFLPRWPCRFNGADFGDHVIVTGDKPSAVMGTASARRDERISVLIPTYNEGVKVIRAINSILKQSVLPREIVVVDDGSDDNTEDLIRGLANPLVRYHKIEHAGRGVARNEAARMARGEYVALLDADDASLPGRLAAQAARLDETGADIVFSDGFRIDEARGALQVRHYAPFTAEEMPRCLYEGLTGVCPILNTSMMLRRSVYERVGLYDETWTRCEDYQFYVRLAAQGEIRVELVEDPLVIIYQPIEALPDDKRIEEYLQYSKLLDFMLESFPIERLVRDLDLGRVHPEAREDLERLAVAQRRVDLIRHFRCTEHHESLASVRRDLEVLARSSWEGIASTALSVKGGLESDVPGSDLARSCYERAIAISPDNADARRRLSQLDARQSCDAAEPGRSDGAPAAVAPDGTGVRRVGLYYGWIGHGNLGDECMFEACKGALPAIRWQVFYDHQEASVKRELSRMASGSPDAPLEVSGVLGGGTFINRHPQALRRYLNLSQIIGRPAPVFGTGVASPVFWTGRGHWQDTRSQWAECLRELPVVGVRGPHSKELLEEVGLTNVEIVGDSGLLFERRRDPDRATNGVVAVNIGQSEGFVWGGDEEAIERETIALVKLLVSRGIKVELVPIWDADIETTRRVLAGCGEGGVRMHNVTTSAEAFMDRLKDVDVLVGLKLHALVLAAAANVPFYCLEYRPKCRDFARSVDWEDYCVRTSDMKGGDVAERVAEMTRAAPGLRRRLAGSVHSLNERFRGYCRFLNGEPTTIAEVKS